MTDFKKKKAYGEYLSTQNFFVSQKFQHKTLFQQFFFQHKNFFEKYFFSKIFFFQKKKFFETCTRHKSHCVNIVSDQTELKIKKSNFKVLKGINQKSDLPKSFLFGLQNFLVNHFFDLEDVQP